MSFLLEAYEHISCYFRLEVKPMSGITLKGKKTVRQKSSVPVSQTKLTSQEIDRIRSVARVKHGQALIRALVSYYACETTELRNDLYDRKLGRLFEEFDEMDKSELARDVTDLIRELAGRYGPDGLKRELSLAFGRRG